MSRRGCLLVILVASTQIARAAPSSEAPAGREGGTSTPVSIPTVTVYHATPVSVPTVTIPKPTPTAGPVRPVKPPRTRAKGTAGRRTSSRTHYSWVWAFLTSYCPGSAGWLSASGVPVFYGMLANNHYAFGTHVYMPVIGITGVVEDREGDSMWNHFDVWSGVCYSTPTGWFKVAVVG